MSPGNLSQRQRVLSATINVLIAWLVHRSVSGSWAISGESKDAWFVAVTAFWLLHLISSPYFTPPKDSLANAVGALIALVTLGVDGANANSLLVLLKAAGLVIASLVALSSIYAIASHSRHKASALSNFCYRFSSEMGRGAILFSPVVLVSAFVGYADNAPALLSISVLWVAASTIGMTEFILRVRYEFFLGKSEGLSTYIGTVERFDSPGIARVRIDGTLPWNTEAVYAMKMENGTIYAVLPIFEHLSTEGRVGTAVLKESKDLVSRGKYLEVHLPISMVERTDMVRELAGADNPQLVGMVVEGASISAIRFESIVELEKGQVVFVNMDGRRICYQISDAVTGEESLVSQFHGRRIASAVQLGEFAGNRGFVKFDWVPPMNSCVFLINASIEFRQEKAEEQFSVGVLPGTGCEALIDVDNLVHYHAAILGVTGTGKTELSLDVVRESVKRGCKVVCVDFTGEYSARLNDLKIKNLGLSADLGGEYEKAIFAVETGAYGAPAEKAALKKFVDEISPLIDKQVHEFLDSEDDFLAVLELAEITNTKATLRTTELFLSSFMAWAKNNRRKERILLVLEEAHTIVPETGGSGMDYDSKWVVDRIGQIALQGRKYGIGLLVVSQRTALVSKTILSQCNTFFAFALVDQTSLNFLTSVLSSEQVSAIPNLRPLEFICYGKALSSERPLLVRRVFDKSKEAAARALDAAS